jgi:hypothetical protein
MVSTHMPGGKILVLYLNCNILSKKRKEKKKRIFHLLACCANKHMNNLRTTQHNKAIHALAKTLLAHPTTYCFTLINAGNIKDHKLDNTIPSWLLPCTCYLSRCKCLARLTPNILCILGAPPINKLPFTSNPNLKVQIFEFIY